MTRKTRRVLIALATAVLLFLVLWARRPVDVRTSTETADTGSALTPEGRLIPWTASSQPVLQIGGSPIERGLQFSDIVAAVSLSDGTLLVADLGQNNVRVYDLDGNNVSTFGGAGEGPGESLRVGSVVVDESAATVTVFDAAQQRLSVFGMDGALERSVRISGPQLLSWVGRFADGSLFGRSANRVLPTQIDGVVRDTVVFYAVAEDGVIGPVLTTVPGGISTQVMLGGLVATRFALFSPTAAVAALGNCFAASAQDLPEITLLDRSGGVVGRLALALPFETVDERHRVEWIDWMSRQSEAEEHRATIEQLGTRIRTPDRLPLTNALLVDELGYLWVQRFRVPHGLGREWIVLHPTGDVIGQILLPAMRVLEVAAHHIIGSWTDDLGEEYIQKYTLERPGSVPPAAWPERCR